MTTASPFPVSTSLPEVSRTQMQEVDRLMIEEYEISLFQMMENAGRALAIVARDMFLGGDATGKRVLVLTGSGGNAGGALTAARRLAIWGAQIDLGMARAPDALTPVPRQQHKILHRVAAPAVHLPDALPPCDLIIDGLIGYSLNGVPRGKTAAYIDAVNTADAPVLSLDVPSGYDAATGRTLAPSIMASATLTLALPKTGMQGATTVGQLLCADISVPPGLYAALGLPAGYAEMFRLGDIVSVAP
ncbi:NAD(P)H-hydrate epimerase [Litoreibacter albidus]|uniref:NAD(P)H-hydrate epimerase n=1 Tax=Litoreibacter albidus TaxID=670155 RepID=UPI003736260A